MNTRRYIFGAVCLLLLAQMGEGQLSTTASMEAAQGHLGAYRTILSAMPAQQHDPGLPDKCGLSVITYAWTHRDALPTLMRSDANRLLTRPATQKDRLIGNFAVHYDTVGTNAAALLDGSHQRIPGTADVFADSVGSILNRVAAYETGTLGYPGPPSDGTGGGGPEYDVYILELGNLYGYTTPEMALNAKPDGATYTTFITIDNDFSFVNPDSNKGIPALRVTLAHEFHHAIQIGNYGYWTNDVFYYEMTSTWMEDVVFPNVNDYLQYVRSSQGQFRHPEISFPTANGIVEYSRAVWCHFIAKLFGRDAIKRSWEQVQTSAPLQAIDNALQLIPYASSFRKAFPEWTLWNYYTGSRSDTAHYPEGNLYPLVTQFGAGFTPPSRDVAGSLDPLAAHYYQIVSDQDTLTLALSNINIAAVVGGSANPFLYTIHLNVNRLDDLYQETAAGIYYKLDVVDRTNWDIWNIVGGSVGPSTTAGGTPFPSPFQADGKASLSIPLPAKGTLSGNLYVFSSSMVLVYSSRVASTLQLGRQVLTWNGVANNNEVVRSGIYFYTFQGDSPNSLNIQGKIAVIRK